MYGPGTRITQAQYDHAAATVDGLEYEEDRRRDMAAKVSLGGGKPEWPRQNSIPGELFSL